jgi:hypothetical protein
MCAQEGLGGALGVLLPSKANDDNAFIFNGPRKRGPRGRLGEWAMGAHGRLSGSITVLLKTGADGGRAVRAILEKTVTTEERFERIEHVTAGLAEERRKDREEFRSLWRGTQRHIDEVAVNLSKLTVQVAEMDDRLGARIEALAEESRAADQRSRERDQRSRERDQRLSERIESLVSAMGEFLASQTRKQI